MNHGFENEDKEPMMIHEHREPIKTLRDEFAMLTLPVLVQSWLNAESAGTIRQNCETAYRWADYMLKAREAE